MNTTIYYAARYLEKSVKRKTPSAIQLEKMLKQFFYNDVLKLSIFVKVIISRF